MTARAIISLVFYAMVAAVVYYVWGGPLWAAHGLGLVVGVLSSR